MPTTTIYDELPAYAKHELDYDELIGYYCNWCRREWDKQPPPDDRCIPVPEGE